jgi:hypothetical protein
MRTTRVTAVSINGYLGEPERVLRAIDGWREQVAAKGVELVLFPELVIHGHCTPNTWELRPAAEQPHRRRRGAGDRGFAEPGRPKHLDLAYNSIGDEGARAFATAKALPSQRFLRLEANRIGYPGAWALVDSPLAARLDGLGLARTPIGSTPRVGAPSAHTRSR